MTSPNLNSCVKEFEDLSKEFTSFETLHKEYLAKLEEMNNLQNKCLKELTHQRYRIGVIKKAMKAQLVKSKKNSGSESSTLEELDKSIQRRKADLKDMEEDLPKKGTFYLQVVLGSVNVSMLQKDEKFKYKDEYEKFKLIVNGLAMMFSVIILFANSRVLDLVFKFLLVWYYCTLTIRESILRVNGSKIKGWWLIHHFIFTILSGVLLIWPNDRLYYEFRPQFLWFSVYISIVQFLQFKYQRACLYRLRTLGEREDMDITIEGFHSWMWRGLGFLLPFLFIAYAFELYNAYTLFQLSQDPEATWPVHLLSLLFFIVFFGNVSTTIIVIRQKMKDKIRLKGRIGVVDKFLRSTSKLDTDASNTVDGKKHQ